MRIHPITYATAAAFVLCANSGVVSQSSEPTTAPYTITDLGTLGGDYGVYATDINAWGQVVGYAYTENARPHPFLWQNGVMTDLGNVGGTGYGYATAINDLGEVVGFAQTTGTADHAFLWQNGVLTDLGTLGGASSWASGINTLGQVVGSAQTSDTYHAFLWQNGVMTDLGTLAGTSDSSASAINASGDVVGMSYSYIGFDDEIAGEGFVWRNGLMVNLGAFGGRWSQPIDINASGQVVGAFAAGNTFRGFLWEDGVMSDLGTLGGNYSQASDINTLGQVVGLSQTIGSAYAHAFLWQSGVMTDLNALLPPGSGWVLGGATAINDSGQIVGYGLLNNQPRAFLLTPLVQQAVAFTVEPETFGEGGQGCWQGPFYCGGGYFDETPGNWGDAHVRPGTDVDLWYDDGGIVIGGLDGLEWLAFRVNVPESGQYRVTFRTASPSDRPGGSGVINVGIHGVDGSWVGNQHVPVTGGPGEWHSYVSWNAPNTIYLPAGQQTLTMWAAGGWYNVRNMRFTLER